MDMGNEWQCRVCNEWSDSMGKHECQKAVVLKAEIIANRAIVEAARAYMLAVRVGRLSVDAYVVDEQAALFALLDGAPAKDGEQQ